MNNDSTAKIKRESWLRYGFWLLAIILVGLAVWFFVNLLNKETANVPSGYLLSVEDHYAKNSATWSTYYVYDTYILVQNDDPDHPTTPVIYDGVNTSSLDLDASKTTRTCDADSCYDYPNVLTAIKKSIAGKARREYVGK